MELCGGAYQGRATLIDDDSAIEQILVQLVEHQESQFENPWRYELPEDFKLRLRKSIVGFAIEMTSIEGKFKLSQNRSAEDWKSALIGAENHYGKSNPELVRLMRSAYASSNSIESSR
jgi:transcriptional regulator